MPNFRMLLAAGMLAGIAAFATGCGEEDGPAEELGESIDETVNDAERAVEDATD